MKSIVRVSAVAFVTFAFACAGFPAVSASQPADSFWGDRFQPAGVTGYVQAMLSRPGALFVGGNLTAVGDLPVANVARLTTSGGVVTGATALGPGLDGGVYDFCEHGGQVVAGGLFGHSGETELNNVGVWDGAAWQPLGAGLPGEVVRTLASYGGSLYAGAYRWDGAAWTDVLQTDGTIMVLEVHDGLLYVGGYFNTARGIPVNHAFAWDGADVLPLGDGLPDQVMASSAGDAGVVFVSQGDENYGKAYRWDGAGWVVERENTFLQSAAFFGTDLVVSNWVYIGGGQFQPAIQSDRTGSWVTVGGFTTNVMCEHEGVLFIRSAEGVEPGVLSPGLIVYDGLGLREAFPPGNGYGRGFHALAPLGAGVLVGGDFVMADGEEYDGAGLCYDGGWMRWGGRSDLATSFPGRFVDLEFLGSEAFGVYSYTDWDVEVQILAKSVWTGAAWQWQMLDPLMIFYGDLVTVGSELVNYNVYGVNSVDPVGGTLTPLPGLDLDGSIRGACDHLGELVICGNFTTNGGVAASNVLRYTGGVWEDVGDPLPAAAVTVVTATEGTGLAVAIQDVLQSRVALFDGVEWSVLEGVFDRPVSKMVYHRGRLFVAGNFDWVGAVNAPGVAAWTGTEWAPVGRGVMGNRYDRVTDIVSAGDHLWLAGNFTMAGGHLSVGLAEWTGDPAMLTGGPTWVPEDTPGAIRLLHDPTPNPFNPRTTVSFDLPREEKVTIGIFDVRGAMVRSLTAEVYPAGNHAVVWNGDDDAGRAQPSGVYFAMMSAGGTREAVKLTLVR